MDLGAPKSTREWWYLISIIVLCEFIFLHFIYTKGYDADSQRAWEFGHVLVAIVLAVIAIIYGFLQAESQSRTGNRIESAVNTLDRVSSGLEQSEGTLRTGLAKLEKILPHLQDIKSSVSGTSDAVSRLEKKIEAKLEDVARAPIAAPPSSPSDIKLTDHKVIQQFLIAASQESNANIFIVLFALQQLDGKDVKLLKGVLKTVHRATFELSPDDDKDFKWIMAGLFRGMARTIFAMGYGSEENGITLLPAFKMCLDQTFVPAYATVDENSIFGLIYKYAAELPNRK